MKPARAVGVLVKVMGLLGWLVGLFYLASTLIALLSPNHRAGIRPWWRYAVAAVFFFAVEWLLLRRADRVVAFTDHRDTAETP